MELARTCIACIVALGLGAPTTGHAALGPSAASKRDDEDASKDGDAQQLLARAEIRRTAGDDAGAIALLADALELGLTGGIAPRTEARIKLTLFDMHTLAGHRDTAEALRLGLLHDKDRLRLTLLEVERLQRAGEPPKAEPKPKPKTTTAAKPATVPAPTAGRGASSVVEEKVIESEVFSNRKMISSGIGMTTVGLGFALGGVVLLLFARSTEASLDEYEIPEQESDRSRAIRDGNAQNGAGIAFVSIGGVLVLAGVTLAAVGFGRKRAGLGKGRRHKSAQLVPSASGIGVRF